MVARQTDRKLVGAAGLEPATSLEVGSQPFPEAADFQRIRLQQDVRALLNLVELC